MYTVRHELKLLADEFGLKRDTKDDRIRLQKIVYLLQASGIGLGYGFSWYNHGPYSQDLVYDAYSVLKSEAQTYSSETQDLKFLPTVSEKLGQFKGLLSDAWECPEKLELIASVDFVRTIWYPCANREAIPEILRHHKQTLFDGTAIGDEAAREAFDISRSLREN